MLATIYKLQETLLPWQQSVETLVPITKHVLYQTGNSLDYVAKHGITYTSEVVLGTLADCSFDAFRRLAATYAKILLALPTPTQAIDALRADALRAAQTAVVSAFALGKQAVYDVGTAFRPLRNFVFPADMDALAAIHAILVVFTCITLVYVLFGRIIPRLIRMTELLPTSNDGSDVKETNLKRAPVYLTDFATFRSFKPEWTINADEWARRASKWFGISDDTIKFNRMILDRSGISDQATFPPGIAMFPPDTSIAAARHEAEIVMFDCIDQLFKRNNIKPKDIDIVVTNCSLFNPTPSLAAMIINHYKLREDVVCYNLSGMGCSAGVIAIDLASDMLRLHPKKDPIAIVMSMENITQNVYMGQERGMMVANSLFRMGGAAMLLTRHRKGRNGRPDPRWRLNNLVRVHLGSDCNAYTCVFQDVDKDQRIGVRLDKNLMKVAARALEKNMIRLGPQILPITEKLRFAYKTAMRWIQVQLDPTKDKTLPRPVPNFKAAIDHICIHAGGRAVIDAIQQALFLTDEDVKPSRDVLFKYGNTSSSSIWYELQEIEETRKPKRGEKVWQIAFGSGFKCNSAVWEKL